MKNKTRKLFYKIALSSPTFLTIPLVISCSSTDEFTILQNEIKEQLVKNYQEFVEIIWNEDNRTFENVDSLFDLKVSERPFTLRPTSKWNEWNDKVDKNNKLTDIQKKRLKLTKHTIVSISIPSLTSKDQEINQIKIIIDLSNGPVANNIIEHEFVLDNQHVKNRRIENNNFTETNFNNYITSKETVKNLIARKVATLGEINDDILASDQTKLNFNIEKKYSDHIYQNNIRTFFDKDTMNVTNNVISEIIVYFSDTSKSTKEDIINSSIYYVLNGIEIKK